MGDIVKSHSFKEGQLILIVGVQFCALYRGGQRTVAINEKYSNNWIGQYKTRNPEVLSV